MILKSASRDHRRHPLGSDRCESAFGFCERPMRVTTVDDRCRPFFFDDVEFSEKGFWARGFGKHFGSSGGVREGILGHPGGGPGGILEGPGGSGGHLGRVLGGLGAILERLFEQFNF